MSRVYRIARAICRWGAGVYFRWRVLNVERAPLTGPCILASNHESYVDPVLIGAAIEREIYYLARAPAVQLPVLGRLLRLVNVFPINQTSVATEGLRASLAILGAGHALVMFPEGTRTHDGSMGRFKLGIGMIVAQARVPVTPVRVSGLYQAYGRHMWFPRPRRPVVIAFGHPMTFEKHWEELKRANKTERKRIYREITDAVEDAIAKI